MGKDTDKRWKAFSIDWAVISDMDSVDFELKALNQQQVAILLALLQYQKWETRWVNLGITKDELQAYIGDIEYRLMLNQDGTMSCEDIEDCLGESTTITNIENNITNIDNEITTINQTIIQREEDCGCGGGNVYPEPPSDWNDETPTGDSSVCGSAFYIADQIIGLIAETIDDEANSTQAEWLTRLLGTIGGFATSALAVLWSYIAGSSNANLLTEVQAARSVIAEAFFCSLLDKDAARAEIADDTTITADAKTAILNALDCILNSSIEQWAFIGSQTVSEACEDFCSWVVVWDFDGSYVPVGDEDAIFTGNTWTVSGGTYDSSIGYSGLQDTWVISKALPPDCKLGAMVHNCNRIPGCQFVDIRKWSGSAWSASARVINTTPFSQNWGANSVAQTEIRFEHNHGLCGSPPIYGSQTHWVRAAGTGARPTG